VLLRKAVNYAVVAFVILSLNFFMFHVLPGDISIALLPRFAKNDPVEQAKIAEFWGFDDPLIVQYGNYLGQLVQFDLGQSYIYRLPVGSILWDRLPITALLVGVGTLIAAPVGIYLGAKAGARRGGPTDYTILTSTLTTYSMPSFWLGLILLMVFAGTLQWFPSGLFMSLGFHGDLWETAGNVLWHLALPLTTFILTELAFYVLIIRSSLVDVLTEDYITTARAKGVAPRGVLWRHAVPNALLPITTVVAVNVGYILGGAIMVETVYSYPGLGRLTWDAVLNKDYPVLQGAFLLLTMAVLVANFVADFLYAYLDPRIRLED